MKFFVRSKIGLVLIGFVVAVFIGGGGNANADFIFGEPTNLGPTVNSSAVDESAGISADGLSLFFDSTRQGGSGAADIWVTRRASVSDPWGAPVNLGPTVNSSAAESLPSISADGLSLYFSDYDSPRPGGVGGYDLWLTTRATKQDPWGEPANLGSTVNSAYGDATPVISADGLELFFCSTRPGGYGNWDLWVTTRTMKDENWSAPVNLGPAVNSSTPEILGSSISADGLTLLFASGRPGGYGGYWGDIWVTTRTTTDNPWQPPLNLGPMVNSSANEIMPGTSADGRMLYFSSDRTGGVGGYDLWQVSITLVIDFNGDKMVDFKDFSILAQYWRQEESLVDIAPLPLGDRIVNFKDVAVLVENWLAGPPPGQASNPNPADGALGVDIAADLSWTPGDVAALHEVYFGSDPFALPLVGTQPVGQDSYDPPGDLIPGTTYYWRIDEVNDAGPPPGNWPGVLWSFTTIALEATNPNPADGATDVSTMADLSWTAGVGAPSHDVYFGTVSSPPFVRNQSGTTFDPGTMTRRATYYWRIDEVGAHGTITGTVWRFATGGPPP